MLGEIASLGIGLCVDHALGKVVSTAGMKTAEKIITKIGLTATSLAVGHYVDGVVAGAEKQWLKIADKICRIEIIEEETE